MSQQSEAKVAQPKSRSLWGKMAEKLAIPLPMVLMMVKYAGLSLFPTISN
jgi:hypothetical protein